MEVTEGWQYRWGDSPLDSNKVRVWTYKVTDESEWRSHDYSNGITNPPDRQDHEVLWLRIDLPAISMRDPHIWIKHMRFACEVYLDSRLVYRFKSIGTPGQGKFTEDTFHLFPLDIDFQNKIVFFRIYSEDTSVIGLENVYLGSYADFIEVQMKTVLPSLIFSFLFISIGLIPLILFIIKSKDKTYFIFGLFCISVGMWTLNAANAGQYLLNARRFWFYVSVPFPFLTAVAICAHFEQIFGPGYKSIIRRLWQFFLFFTIVGLSLFYSNMLNMRALLSIQLIFLALLGITMLILLSTSIHAAFKGNREATIITIGFVTFSLSAIYDIIGGAFNLIPWSQNTYYWGVFFFIVSLGFVLERRFQRYALELEDSNKKLEEYSHTLEQKVEERTKKLKEAQDQLIMKEKMASLGNLVAGVAHEVNTPIGAIHSAADASSRCLKKMLNILKTGRTLDDVMNSDHFRKTFEILENNNNVTTIASGKIAKIVKSLKTFARLGNADYQEVNIHEGLDITLTMIDHEIKNKISVNKEYGEIPEINCYPDQLNQVFINVLMNAVQAIEKEGQITIKTYQANNNVIIEISDTGHGIPPENIDKIFNPGFTTRGVGVGTGLGLSICFNIIQKHQGQIKVESEVGKGTTFTIILPTDLKTIESNAK